MTAVARHTDPDTSHEAAAGVNLIRSQMAVMTFANARMGVFFTNASLVAAYQAEHAEYGCPRLSDSRIRTARLELAAAGLMHYAGKTRREGVARSEQVWSTNPDAALERRVITQEDAA